jgi:ParB family transcriptional regulator, chromosome partitioning protein
MTSGKFKSFPVPSIIANRPDRQRRELTGIEELAESIHRIGLINPIVITEDGVLVAGERRLTACRSLGWTSIPVQFTSDLSEYELHCIELEENIKRVDLPWQDQCLAIDRFHKLKVSNEPDWNQEKTAQALGLASGTITKQLSVASEIVAGNEKVATADKFSVARNIVERNNERKKTSALSNADTAIASVLGLENDEMGERSKPQIPILNCDFHQFQEVYDGPPYNLIHCDFPYGINVADSPRQNSAISDHYADSADVYWDLLARLGVGMGNMVAESAHLIFWFSMEKYGVTKSKLQEMGWEVNPFPLIWHKSDNAGVAPDPQRTPRRTYETAFFCARGDRKLTQAGAKSNSFSFPGNRSEAIHVSEKPKEVLRHFMSMVCDEYSLVFDPTCGSGNALKVGLELKANAVLGLELSKEFYENAVAGWVK